MAARCSELGLAVTIETGARFLLDPKRKHEPTLISPEPEGRARRVDFYRKAIEIAVDLDAEIVSLWSGVDHAKAPEACQWLLEGLLETADAAAQADVRIAFEPEPGMLVESAGDGLALVAEMDHPALGLTVDTGHLVVMGEPVGESLTKAGELLLNVHLDDSVPGKHEHLQFGEGELDLAEVFSALNELHYEGPANVELSRHSPEAQQAVQKAHETLQRFLTG